MIFLVNFIYNLHSRQEEERSLIRREARALISYHLVAEELLSDRYGEPPVLKSGHRTQHLDIMTRMRESFRLFSETSDHTLRIIGPNARSPEHHPDRIETRLLEEMQRRPDQETCFFYDAENGRYYYLRRMNYIHSCRRCHTLHTVNPTPAGGPLDEFAGAISLQIPSTVLQRASWLDIIVLVLFTLLLAGFSIALVVFFLRRISTLSASLARSNDALEIRNRKLHQLEAFKIDLFQMLIHDMKAPLTFMIGSLQVMLEKKIGTLNGEQEKMVSLVLRGCYRLKEMVSNILDVNRLEEGKLEINVQVIPICDFLESQTAPWLQQAERQDKSFQLECHTLMGQTIHSDPDLLARILENLISNAVKHTSPRTGLIRLVARPAEDDGVLFEVIDNGEGIPAEFMDRLFEKYSVLKNQADHRPNSNTGLGLFFCKLAVETMGGRIWAESEPAEGTTFVFHLPACRYGTGDKSESTAGQDVN
ncbi:MAG: DUF3365 domain-containing protein [Acidobacteria bacterium]|nr:DUF3365 domain-containing protein [Acidobacteriota bacterium]